MKQLTNLNMKKIFLTIGAVVIVLAIVGWQNKSYSVINLPHSEATTCNQAYENSIAALENSWEENVQTMLDQEKPASEMVEEGFENLRSYECMMEYVCRAVQFSGYGAPSSAVGTGLRHEHIGQIPGCQQPEDVGLPSGFEEVMMSIITLGYDQADIQYNKIPFYEQCMTSPNNNPPDMIAAKNNYEACINLVEKKFACIYGADENTSPAECTNNSISFVKLETALKKNSADQKAGAFEKKMGDILAKMLAMEANVGYLKAKLTSIDARYDCKPYKCD